MSSSISSFSDEAKAVWLTLLILGCADLGLRLSEARLSLDVRHIRSIPEIAHQLSAGPAPRVLFLGNSLTRHGVDPGIWRAAREELGAPGGSLAKLVPDDTTMPDWYYVALNHVIQPGDQPDLLILGFVSNQLTDDRIAAGRLGAYFCQLGNLRELFAEDLAGVGPKVDFLLGWLSRLYGVRDEIQARFGTKFIPGYQEGLRHLNENLRREAPGEKVSAPAGNVHAYRLLDRALALWRSRGIEVVLVAMPTPFDYELDPAVVLKARAAGVRLIDARQLPDLTREDFPDGYHMGPRAAEIYTRFIAERLADVRGEGPGHVRISARSN